MTIAQFAQVLIIKANRRLHAKSSEPKIYLPTEIWEHVCFYLPTHVLQRLYYINRIFYHVYISRLYKEIWFDLNPSHFHARSKGAKMNFGARPELFKVFCNPEIAEKVQIVHVNPEFQTSQSATNKIFRFLPRALRAKYFPETFLQDMEKGMCSLCNVQSLFISYQARSTPTYMDLLWKSCCQTIVRLDILLSPSGIRHFLCLLEQEGDRGTCTNLRSLRIHEKPGWYNDNILSLDTVPVPGAILAIRKLIPLDGGVLDELVVVRNYGQIDTTVVFPTFGAITKLALWGELFPPGITINIHPPISAHLHTLKEIRLGEAASNDIRDHFLPDPDIIEAISVYAKPFFEARSVMFPRLSTYSNLRTLEIQGSPPPLRLYEELLQNLSSSLQHLQLPYLVIHRRLLIQIARSLPNMRTFVLYRDIKIGLTSYSTMPKELKFVGLDTALAKYRIEGQGLVASDEEIVVTFFECGKLELTQFRYLVVGGVGYCS